MEYLKGMSQAMKQAQSDNTSESFGYMATELVKGKNPSGRLLSRPLAGPSPPSSASWKTISP